MTDQDLSGSIGLTRLSTTGSFRKVRTARLAATSTGNEMMILSVGLRGDFRARQDGWDASLSAGTAVLYQAGHEWELQMRGDSQAQVLRFSRDALPAAARDVGDTGPGLSTRSPATALLGRYLHQLDASAAGLSPRQRADAGEAAIVLLTMALRDTRTAMPDASDPVFLDLLQAYVRDHLADSLTVDDLARLHHVSARHIYHLFERAGTTPGAYVRTLRLGTARDILADPAQAGLSIKQVAAMTGFPNVRTFYRAFQQRFETTPDGFRHDHRPPFSA
ncbi:AraC family transcriptional regulator [Actinoplanes sp. TBRC 11911]|uniref:helix-turn-helix transcriptional regulator n=1 Tax=Actinoplanes sp. TBRC 11911 TaxID=2729386 RepID=UPI0020071D7E|nr:AraC family transcriptional regulator [Actinoplanes sp. TBRC 11911]